MLIREVMSRDIKLVSPQDTIKEAAEMMRACDCGALPVGAGDRLIGMITDRDIALRAVARGKGRTVTSWPSLKTDLRNAGAHWVDREVVADDGLVTSRKPDDLPAFCREMIRLFQAGAARQRQAAE